MTGMLRWSMIGSVPRPPGQAGSARFEQIVLASGEASPCHPGLIDSTIRSACELTRVALQLDGGLIGAQDLQLSLRPVLAGELRPSFGLSVEALRALADINASLDFDPYQACPCIAR